MPSFKTLREQVLATPDVNKGRSAEYLRLPTLHRQFVDDVVHKGMSISEAQERATGRRSHSGLINTKRVAAAVAAERAIVAKQNSLTKKKVIDGILEAIELAKSKSDPSPMIAGWREIAKMCGFYEAVKADLTVTVQGKAVLDKLNALSDVELANLIGSDDVIDAEVVEVTESMGAPDAEV